MNNNKMERNKLIEKANKDLEEYIAGLKPKKYEEGWSEANWEEEMEQYPLFRKKPLEEGEEIPPLIEAMQQLKYDPEENTSEELARNYKDDGNQNFRLKKYRWAIDCYTEGLKKNCQDVELQAQLYTNRAAAHFHLGNYRSSLKDAMKAKAIKPAHMKAIARGSYCCFELKLFQDCITWCTEGLDIDPENKKLEELCKKAKEEKEIYELNQKRASLREEKKRKEEEDLKQAIIVRGIKILTKDSDTLEISHLEPIHPAAINKVHFNDNRNLVWPVIFAYPEVGEIDCIQNFEENTSFYDHLSMMFGSSENRPEWDLEKRYTPESLQVYFEDKQEDCLISINSSSELMDVLHHKRLFVENGTPTFIIMVKDSEFERDFRNRYKEVQ